MATTAWFAALTWSFLFPLLPSYCYPLRDPYKLPKYEGLKLFRHLLPGNLKPRESKASWTGPQIQYLYKTDSILGLLESQTYIPMAF